MDEIEDIRKREVAAYFSFVSNADTQRAIDARTYHVLREYDDEDFYRILDLFEAADAVASVAFLGCNAEERADVMAAVDDRGHEVVCHGHRHVKFGDLSYETAHDDLSAAVSAIRDVSGVTPTGFFAPFKEVSEGTLRAASELGFDWVLGSADDSEVPADIRLIDSVYPHDTRLLEGGTSPGETFSQLEAAAEQGSTFLFHPNMLEYYDALGEFEAWIDATDPVSVSQLLEGDNGEIGVVLDCLSPMRIR
jgi:peptidoglycan/xylan/chitin deacetylase (PgdA/CDA1 family)